MNKLKIFFISSISAVLFACNSLDITPPNVTDDANIFGTYQGVTTNLAFLYQSLPNFNGNNNNLRNEFGTYTGETLLANISGMNNVGGETAAYWNYEPVRNINIFLSEIVKYPEYGTLVDNWMGEVYFLRAYLYFRMVKAHGGVPIVNELLDYPAKEVGEYKMPRDKEEACYDFILEDLDKAINLLPEESKTTQNARETGHANRYAAYALKARVALHAACIAKYGVTGAGEAYQKGILGIPSARAKDYFEKALEAAKEVKKSGKYELFRKYPTDLVTNYMRLFIDNGAGAETNKEILFAKYYLNLDGSNNFNYRHNWDGNACPTQFSIRANDRNYPTVSAIEMFDDIDGNPFRLNTGTDASPVLYPDADGTGAEAGEKLFERAEPRLKASVVYPGSLFGGTVKNEVIEIRKGIIPKGFSVSDVNSALVTANDYLDEYEEDGNRMHIAGASGFVSDGYICTHSGFYLRKMLDPDLPKNLQTTGVQGGGSTSPTIVIRYAEVLLTLAEAAMELGKDQDLAAECINDIRERAGSKKRFSAAALTLNDVRRERGMELYAEGSAYWDKIRWRTFHTDVSTKGWDVLWPVYVWDSKSYYFRRMNTGDAQVANKLFTFESYNYYQKVPDAERIKNDLLIQNPGY